MNALCITWGKNVASEAHRSNLVGGSWKLGIFSEWNQILNFQIWGYAAGDSDIDWALTDLHYYIGRSQQIDSGYINGIC